MKCSNFNQNNNYSNNIFHLNNSTYNCIITFTDSRFFKAGFSSGISVLFSDGFFWIKKKKIQDILILLQA